MIGLPEDSIKAMYLIKTHYIMRVIKFHPEDQTVDLIQDTYDLGNVLIGDMVVKNELGQYVTVGVKEPTILTHIPVKQERWGQFEIQACPQEGDTGYIEVFTTDITDWMENGGLSIPPSDRHFIKDSSVFVPFVPNKKNCSETYPEDGTKLIIRSKNAKITITDNGETADVSIDSNTITMAAPDGVSITGNVNVDGTIHATQNVTAGDNNTALVGHTHGFNYIGAGQGSSPQTGTTDPTQ